MAYSATGPSNTYLPSENLAWFTTDSTDKNEDSFVYRYRLQVTDSNTAFTTGSTGADVVGTFRVPPRPVTGLGYFSPMAVAKTYVTTPLGYPAAGVAGLTGSGVKKFRITFGQEYIDGAGLTGSDEVTGSTYYFWNSIINDEDYPTYSQTPYVITNGTTGTVMLTDGPSERCPLENDLLYALIGADTYDAEIQVDELINGTQIKFQTPANFGFYTEAQPLNDSNPSFTWTTIGGNGIDPDNGGIIGGGEYSLVVTYDQTATYGPTFKLGPVWTGTEISIILNSAAPWSGLGTYNEIWLFGLNLDGDWVPIRVFDEVQRLSNSTIQYQIGVDAGDYTIAADYQLLGFAYYNVGEVNAPVIAEIDLWTYNYPPVSWEQNASSFVQPKRYSLDLSTGQVWLTYLNTGTDGVGLADETSEFKIINGLGVALSETITYNPALCSNCSNCEKVNITWLNSLGGYDTLEFNCLSGKQLDVTRVIGERTLTPGYTKGQRGRLNTSNIATRSKVVSTNYETQQTVDWLESLFMSPDAYEVQPDGTFIPIIIDTSSYSQFVNQDKIKIVEFAYSLAYNRKSQLL